MFKKVKKVLSVLLITIFLASSFAVPASAACPNDGNMFIQNFCSGVLEHIEAQSCSWAGGYGAGVFSADVN